MILKSKKMNPVRDRSVVTAVGKLEHAKDGNALVVDQVDTTRYYVFEFNVKDLPALKRVIADLEKEKAIK